MKYPLRNPSRSLMPSSSVPEFSNLQNRIDRVFNDFFSEFPSLPWVSEFETTPSCDIDESDTHYLVSMDLPGVKKEDIRLEIVDNQLIVSGERHYEKEENERHTWRQSRRPYRMERFSGGYSRSFALPAGVHQEQIEANYHDGVLDIAIPKTEPSQVSGQKIEIQEGVGPAFSRGLTHQREGKSQKGKVA